MLKIGRDGDLIEEGAHAIQRKPFYTQGQVSNKNVAQYN